MKLKILHTPLCDDGDSILLPCFFHVTRIYVRIFRKGKENYRNETRRDIILNLKKKDRLMIVDWGLRIEEETKTTRFTFCC